MMAQQAASVSSPPRPSARPVAVPGAPSSSSLRSRGAPRRMTSLLLPRRLSLEEPYDGFLLFPEDHDVPMFITPLWATRHDTTELGECSICTASLVVCDTVNLMCAHLFHAHCLNEWVFSEQQQRRRATCPLCRGRLQQVVTPLPAPRVVIDLTFAA